MQDPVEIVTSSKKGVQPFSPVDNSFVEDYYHQIAGHTNEKVRCYRGKFILKPQNKVELFQREVNFYEDMFSDIESNKQQIEFLAQYHGICVIESENKSFSNPFLLPHLILDDLTVAYKKPTVIDIKMGRQTFEPSASKEKKEREIKKYPYQSDIGFRITGFKIWDNSKKLYHFRNKSYGRSILPNMLTSAVAVCFYDGINFRVDVIQNFLLRLENLLYFMKQQKKYNFYCSSLLVVYDGIAGDANVTTPSHCHRSYCADSSDCCRSAMIDFAHVVHSDEIDHDYVFGVENLIFQLRSILDILSNNDSSMLETLRMTVESLAFNNFK
jgi:inositol-polyphosphate multikinase